MIAPDAKKLIELLVCPRSRDGLSLVEIGGDNWLACQASGVVYPIIDDIVVMDPVTIELKDRCRKLLQRLGDTNGDLVNKLDIEKTRQYLALDVDSGAGWEEAEMGYWEKLFEQRALSLTSVRGNWNRTLPRKQLLERLNVALTDRTILELGCGGATTLYDLYGQNLKHYIGTDLSFNACKLAQRQFPSGLFIQCSASALPFKENSLDVVVAYGVLHHLPGHEERLKEILPILKPGGLFIGSDPILKPSIKLGGAEKKLKAIANAGSADQIRPGASPHNEWIDWHNMLHVIERQAKVLGAHFEYGPLRAVLVNLLFDRLRLRSRTVARALIIIDRIWLATIGRLSRALGPAGVIYTLQRLPHRITS